MQPCFSVFEEAQVYLVGYDDSTEFMFPFNFLHAGYAM